MLADLPVHDKQLLVEFFDPPSKLIEYATEMQLMELCKLFWGVLKRLQFSQDAFRVSSDNGSQVLTRKGLLKMLSGPLPKDGKCAVQGCKREIWICNPRCFWRNDLGAMTYPDASAKKCGGGFLCYHHREMKCPSREHQEPKVMDFGGAAARKANSLDVEKRLRSLNKLTKQSSGTGRVVRLGNKIAVINSLQTPKPSQAKRSLEEDSDEDVTLSVELKKKAKLARQQASQAKRSLKEDSNAAGMQQKKPKVDAKVDAMFAFVRVVLDHNQNTAALGDLTLSPLEASTPPPAPWWQTLTPDRFIEGSNIPASAVKGCDNFERNSSAPKTLQTWKEKMQEYGKTEWILYPLIPANHLTLIFGDPGAAKSSFTVLLAGLITNGGELNGVKYEPSGDVCWLDTEKTLGSNMARGELQGIDLDKIVDIDTEGLMLDTTEGNLSSTIHS